jgi:hypothetical protein
MVPTSREPLRIHAEWSDEGLRLWLGLDARAAPPAPDVEALLHELRRRVETSGTRLVSLVCNGRPVLDARAAGPTRSNGQVVPPHLARPSEPPSAPRRADLTPFHHPEEIP